MSWNDNGKNGSRDPWGNKNDAPDIDEAIKKFKSLIGSFVGGSGGGDSSGSSPSFKRILPTALVETAVQYKRSNPVFYLLEAASPEDSIAQASESALRHVVGSNSMDNVLTTGREQIAIDVRKRLQERLNAYFTGIDVVTVSIRESRPPEAVREAFDDVVKAREEEVTLRNEAETYANEVVPIARGAAKRAIQDAEGYKAKVIAEAEGEATRFDQLLKEYSKAPDVTRKRLYIDAVQSVMSNSTKVMIDVKDGNNIMMLPLDQVAAASIARSNQNTEVENDSGALSGTAIQNLTDQVIEEIRKRQERR